jgi:hypothetical protein
MHPSNRALVGNAEEGDDGLRLRLVPMPSASPIGWIVYFLLFKGFELDVYFESQVANPGRPGLIIVKYGVRLDIRDATIVRWAQIKHGVSVWDAKDTCNVLLGDRYPIAPPYSMPEDTAFHRAAGSKLKCIPYILVWKCD